MLPTTLLTIEFGITKDSGCFGGLGLVDVDGDCLCCSIVPLARHWSSEVASTRWLENSSGFGTMLGHSGPFLAYFGTPSALGAIGAILGWYCL